MKREDGTFQIIALIVMALTLALLLWNLTLRDVGAAPASVTCYSYRAQVYSVTCFLGRCKGWATVYVNGLDTVDVRVSGRGLRDGQWRTVQVCR